MFAPRSNRKPDTAATIPGRSAQPISRRAGAGGMWRSYFLGPSISIWDSTFVVFEIGRRTST